VAQKRDIADPKTVKDFVTLVQSPEMLRILLVLTVADIRAVGPGVWNGWKGQLLRELYGATETLFRGGRMSDAAGVARRRLEAIAYDGRTALVEADPEARAWATAMEDAYFVAFTAEEQRAHVALAREAAAGSGASAEARIRADLNAAEVLVAAKDREGLFADLAQAIASLGGNVVVARIFTSSRGEALDAFYVQDIAGDPLGGQSPRTLARLVEALESAALGRPPALEPRKAADLGRTAAFTIAPAVTIDNEASADATVIEVSGRDRPGLLAALARILAEAELSIQSAHIDNYGERAVDAFYVVTRQGKLVDPHRSAAVRARLLEALEDAESAAARPRLERARASAAR
jgi:[protein-PII] uridylyltransferase